MARKRLAARLHLLTVREVQTAPEGDLSDGGGLMLRVRGESASWVLRYTAGTGRRREMGLGVAHRGNAKLAGDSITTARALAAEQRSLLQRGVDPIDERDRSRTAQRVVTATVKAERSAKALTLARAARDYHERVIEPSRTAKHAAQWISSLENHIPPGLWHKPIGDIEAPELLAALLAIKPHDRARNLSQGDRVQETVSRIRQRLDAVFEDAAFHKRCSSNPAAAIRRKMREATPRRPRGSFAAMPYGEVPAFAQRLRNADGIAARCLEFGLLTAARTNEVIGATWHEFDLDAAVWKVDASRMKAKEDHTVYLSPRAVELLREIKALQINDKIVFPSPMDTRKPLSNMAMLTLLGRLSVRDKTTVHGLCRASFSTWANETAAARPDVIEAVLAHEEGNRVRAAYNRAKFADERRALLGAWSDYLQAPRGQVIPLRAAYSGSIPA